MLQGEYISLEVSKVISTLLIEQINLHDSSSLRKRFIQSATSYTSSQYDFGFTVFIFSSNIVAETNYYSYKVRNKYSRSNWSF